MTKSNVKIADVEMFFGFGEIEKHGKLLPANLVDTNIRDIIRSGNEEDVSKIASILSKADEERTNSWQLVNLRGYNRIFNEEPPLVEVYGLQKHVSGSE